MPVITNCNILLGVTNKRSRDKKSKVLSIADPCGETSRLHKEEIGKSRTLLKRYKQQLTWLSKVESQVAIGIMLGDG